MAYLAFLRLTVAAEAAAALAFILPGEPGQADLDLPRDRSTESERKGVIPRGLQGEGTGGGTFLTAFGDGGLMERESVAETGVLGSWRKTDV